MIRPLLACIALCIGAQHSWAFCPTPDSYGTDENPPTVSLAATERSNAFAIVVRTDKPVCLVTLEVVTQGSRSPFALLSGAPTETSNARARTVAGISRYSFLVLSWLPAGETRYQLWFGNGQTYVALDGQQLLWKREGSLALPAKLAGGTWGVLQTPVRRKATKSRNKPAQATKATKAKKRRP